MYCVYCGKELNEHAVLCPHCGRLDPFTVNATTEARRAHCVTCGKEVDERAVICVHCGTPTAQAQPSAAQLPYNGFAISGFICSILAWILMPIDGLVDGLFCLFSVIAIALSVVGFLQCKKGDRYRGRGLSLAGIIIGSAIFALLFLILFFSLGLMSFLVLLFR